MAARTRASIPWNRRPETWLFAGCCAALAIVEAVAGAQGVPDSSSVKPAPPPPSTDEATRPPARLESPGIDDQAILGTERGWSVEAVRARTTVFVQDGRSGYQSQAGPVTGPGSEQTLIVQPSGLVTLRQNADITHQLVVPVDIVSAASANSIDALSIASAVNEAVSVDWATMINLGGSYTFNSLISGHLEEPWRAGTLSLGIERSLADENASLGLNLAGVFDHFNNNLPDGGRRGRRTRGAGSVNLSFSQILSPTTLLLANYGFTLQRGTLHQPWNSVPLVGGFETPARRGGERFPSSRARHAISGEVAQHLPASQSTLRANYRYYRDDFEVRAHTASLSYAQYLARHWLARTSYRFHTQTAVDFFGTSFPQTVAASAFDLGAPFEGRWIPPNPQTADSDLDAFNAHETGVWLSWFDSNDTSIDVSYLYYVRTNGLIVNVLSLGYSAGFQ